MPLLSPSLASATGASMNHADRSRQSACQASSHAAGMQVSTVRRQQHACTLTAVVVAHSAAAPQCPSAGDSCPSHAPAAHLMPVLTNARVFFDRTSLLARPITRARRPVRSARPASPCKNLMRSCVTVDFFHVEQENTRGVLIDPGCTIVLGIRSSRARFRICNLYRLEV